MDKITLNINANSKKNIEYYSKPENKKNFVSILVTAYKMNGNNENEMVGENGLKTVVQGCCTSLNLTEPDNDVYQKLINEGYHKLKPEELITKFLDECQKKL